LSCVFLWNDDSHYSYLEVSNPWGYREII
jgi:hypothetical protein